MSEKLEVGAAGRGVIAARTISTVADYATTGVSGQGNVLFLFYGSETLKSARRQPASATFVFDSDLYVLDHQEGRVTELILLGV
jgi:cytolysin (calcineurin-like family phosphatase)